MPNANRGHFPPTNDDGSYKDVDMQFNRFILKPDGKTIVDTKTGSSYDLSNIGGGGSSVLSDGDSDGLYEQDKDGFDVPIAKQKQTRYTPTEVTSSYTTAGESVIYADSSGGAFPITLASADATDGNVVEIYDVGESAGTNAITIDTEGSETINPGGKSSIKLSLNGGFAKLRCRAGNWFTDRNRQSNRAQTNTFTTDDLSVTNAPYVAGETTDIREEHGTVSHADPGTASDGTWDTATGDNQSVSFGTAFSATPVVFCTEDSAGAGKSNPKNPSTTGFTAEYFNYSSANSTGPNDQWLAVGPE